MTKPISPTERALQDRVRGLNSGAVIPRFLAPLHGLLARASGRGTGDTFYFARDVIEQRDEMAMAFRAALAMLTPEQQASVMIERGRYWLARVPTKAAA